MTYLGIELDTNTQEARLPLEKLQKPTQTILSFLQAKKVTLKEMQSLIGQLNWACNVVVPGRPFLQRLIDSTRGCTKGHHHIRVTKNSKEDLTVWLLFLQDFNGACFFLQEKRTCSHALEFFTDASKSGFGATFGTAWFHGLWPPRWKTYNIVTLELFPIVLALETWAQPLTNKTMVFFTDNEALVSIINRQTSKHQDTMILVRQLVLIALRSNIHFRAKHYPGKVNLIADALSRQEFQKFRELAPQADQEATWIPELPPSLNWRH
jgi:hypothetical protein